MSKIVVNTSNIPSDVIRGIAALVAPPSVTRYALKIINGPTRSGASGWAYGSSKFVSIKVGAVERAYRTSGVEGKGYLVGIAIGGRAESFLYVLAHELRHLWQAKHSRGLVWGSRGRYSERDADAYALRILRAWRRREIPGLAELMAQVPAGKPLAQHRAEMAARRAKTLAKMEAWNAKHAGDPSGMSQLPPALRAICPPGCTFSGDCLDAPPGYVWAANSCHWLTIVEPADLVECVKEGLARCDEEECEHCHPEAEDQAA